MAAVSRFEVGSSKSSTSVPCAMAWAQATFCSSPPDNSVRLRFTRLSMPTWRAARLLRRLISAGSRPWFSLRKASSLRTSVVKNWLRGFWNTVALTPPDRARSSVGMPSPHTLTSPYISPLWNCGIRPLSRRRAVDLPDPLPPHSTVSEPRGTVKLTSRSAGVVSASDCRDWDWAAASSSGP